MSFYEDATIADLDAVLQLVRINPLPVVVIVRFVQALPTGDLKEVLQDLMGDIAGGTYPVAGELTVAAAQIQAADALQGIEDQEQASVSLSTTNDGDTLVFNTGGTAIET